DYAGAAAAYRQHFRQTIESGHSSFDAAYDALLVEDFDRARSLEEKILAHGPFEREALLTLGEAELQTGGYEAALVAFRIVLEHYPRQFEASVFASIAELRSGRPTGALDFLNQALRDYSAEQRITALLA